MVMNNSGTTGQTASEYCVVSRSSTFHSIFKQFSFVHHINPKELKRINAFYYFQGHFHIFKGNFTKFQENSRTNDTFFRFQDFSRTKVKFKDFSRSELPCKEPPREIWLLLGQQFQGRRCLKIVDGQQRQSMCIL